MTRRYSLAAVLVAVFVPAYLVLLCGGRSMLADRVATLEAVVNEQLVVTIGVGTVVLDLEGIPLR